MTTTVDATASDLLDFACPRCGEAVRDVAFYAPCTDCIAHLRAEVGGVRRDVEAAEYEPKMNVTPNAVALKE